MYLVLVLSKILEGHMPSDCRNPVCHELAVVLGVVNVMHVHGICELDVGPQEAARLPVGIVFDLGCQDHTLPSGNAPVAACPQCLCLGDPLLVPVVSGLIWGRMTFSKKGLRSFTTLVRNK